MTNLCSCVNLTLIAPSDIDCFKSDIDCFNNLQELETYLSLDPLREIAGDKPVVTLPIILYSDDMSGNKSKKWHEFNNWCLLLAGLPWHLNTQLSKSISSASPTLCLPYKWQSPLQMNCCFSRMRAWRCMIQHLTRRFLSSLHCCCASVTIRGLPSYSVIGAVVLGNSAGGVW